MPEVIRYSRVDEEAREWAKNSTYWIKRYQDEIREYQYHLREGIVQAFSNRIIVFHRLTGLVLLGFSLCLPFAARLNHTLPDDSLPAGKAYGWFPKSFQGY